MQLRHCFIFIAAHPLPIKPRGLPPEIDCGYVSIVAHHLNHRLSAITIRIYTVHINEGVITVGQVWASSQAYGANPMRLANYFACWHEFHDTNRLIVYAERPGSATADRAAALGSRTQTAVGWTQWFGTSVISL